MNVKTSFSSRFIGVTLLGWLSMWLSFSTNSFADSFAVSDYVQILDVQYQPGEHEGFGETLVVRYVVTGAHCIALVGGGMPQPLEKARVDLMRERNELDWEEADAYITDMLTFRLDPGVCAAKDGVSKGQVLLANSIQEWKQQWLVQTRLHLTLFSAQNSSRATEDRAFFTTLTPTVDKDEWVAARNLMLMERMEDMERRNCQQAFDGSLKCSDRVAPLVPGAKSLSDTKP